MGAFCKSLKAKSQRAIRINSCESNFIIFAPSYVNSSCQNRFKCCNLHDLIHIVLDNGVTTKLVIQCDYLHTTYTTPKTIRLQMLLTTCITCSSIQFDSVIALLTILTLTYDREFIRTFSKYSYKFCTWDKLSKHSCYNNEQQNKRSFHIKWICNLSRNSR